MVAPLVEFRSVEKRFGDFIAVERVNFTIEAGEFVAIMGPSGCSKTTTLRMLAGLEAPSDGDVLMDGRVMNDVPAHERDTPLVWQSLALFPFLNARENVEFGLQMRGVGASERRQRAMEWLDRMEIAEFAERDIASLSGGQKQRVALARSLVIEPRILLLDEPLSALDANLVIRMQSVLTKLQRELGITFVYVTQSQSEAFAMADRVVIMSRGRIAQVGSPKDIYRAPANRFVAEFVGRNNIISGTVSKTTAKTVTIDGSLGSFTVQTGQQDTRQGRCGALCRGGRPCADFADQTQDRQCHCLFPDFRGIHRLCRDIVPRSRGWERAEGPAAGTRAVEDGFEIRADGLSQLGGRPCALHFRLAIGRFDDRTGRM